MVDSVPHAIWVSFECYAKMAVGLVPLLQPLLSLFSALGLMSLSAAGPLGQPFCVLSVVS